MLESLIIQYPCFSWDIITIVKTQHTSFLPFFVAGSVLAFIGWFGLASLVLLSQPTLGPRWLFIFFAVLAGSGTALPFVHYLNRRFPSKPPVDGAIITRQSVWFGIFFALLIWLQLGRVITFAMAVLVGAGFAVIELLLRMNETARFHSRAGSDE